MTFARQWQPGVPQAAFVGIELTYAARQPDIAALRRDFPTLNVYPVTRVARGIVE